MNSKNKYFARNPNHPIPEMSASEYLGVPYDAEFEAWYENDFKNNGYTMPFLRYMGPGNSTNRGEPVNYADYLSKLHDLRYAYASFLAKNKRITKEQYEDRVNYADHEFVKDQSSWDPQGIIAKAGIGGKMMFEKVIELFGGESHQYPGNPENEDFSTPLDEEVDIIPMAPPKHPFGYTAQGVPKSSSQWQHGIHTAAGNKYGRRGARDPEKFKEYIKLRHQELQKELGERYWQVFKPDAKQYNLHHENRENQSAASIEEAQSNKRPAEENIDEASTSKQTKEGEPSTSTVTEPEPSTSTETTSDTNTTTEKPQETPQESEQMRSKQVSEPMQVDTPANSTMSTGSNVSGGTGIAVAAQQIYSSRGFRQEGNRITYNNHFRTRVYGNALYTAAGATTATTIDPSTCTYPLAALPVEMLAFYIPEGLFNALKDLPNCKPTRIAVKVTPIGVMCSFSTNSSATQSGTTSHTLYGAAVVGLNKKIPVDKVTITRDTSFPMVVSAVAKWSSMDEWIKRIWGQLIPSGTAPIANVSSL